MASFLGRLTPVAVLLMVLAALTVVGALVWAVDLEFVVEGTSDAVFEAAVGSRLRGTALVAAAIVAAGLVVGWPSIWGQPGTAVVRAGVALAALALVVPAGVDAYRRLHPSFEIEKQAVDAFAAPGGARADVITDVRSQRILSATWRIAGTQSSVCPRVDTTLTSWADPGSVGRPTMSAGAYARTARRGPDDVTLNCLSAPAPGSPVDLIIDLTRVR